MCSHLGWAESIIDNLKCNAPLLLFLLDCVHIPSVNMKSGNIIVELCVQSAFLCCLMASTDEKGLVIVAAYCRPQRLLQTDSQRLFSHSVQYRCHKDQSLCTIYLKWTKRLCHKPRRNNPNISKVHCTHCLSSLLRHSPHTQLLHE